MVSFVKGAAIALALYVFVTMTATTFAIGVLKKQDSASF